MTNTAEIGTESKPDLGLLPVVIISPLALLATTSHLAFVFGFSSWTHFDRRVLKRYGLKRHLAATLHMS